ncbi:hypothetical protein CS022_24450 [Veronia nyctiphanis]|uniref:Uncharacterized protein n=1 Tax=Veronia nyctiphanis TaxID=1278244 RepID=A0A4Q0Y9U1_9GAMM|nr:hypothetical protein CS022_24450 [Veronia nyctiphanis]
MYQAFPFPNTQANDISTAYNACQHLLKKPPHLASPQTVFEPPRNNNLNVNSNMSLEFQTRHSNKGCLVISIQTCGYEEGNLATKPWDSRL